MTTLIKLFDSIIHEEYSKGHFSLQHVPNQTTNTLNETHACNLMCDFCGADIFQSFFECRDCGQSKLNESPEAATGNNAGYDLLVCPGCYVEGRICRCGSMTPGQWVPFEQLLVVRNDVQKLVSSRDPDISISPLSDK